MKGRLLNILNSLRYGLERLRNGIGVGVLVLRSGCRGPAFICGKGMDMTSAGRSIRHALTTECKASMSVDSGTLPFLSSVLIIRFDTACSGLSTHCSRHAAV